MNIENINIEELRKDLIDYFGAAMYSGLSLAIIELTNVEQASPEELIKIAIKNGFDISKYDESKQKFRF